MPEGDTIHRSARTLSKAIGGRCVLRASDEIVAGRRVEEVEARGKHLLVRFDDGRTLHTHMGMEGSWHIYRPGERWRRGAHRARFTIETDEWVAVCFDAPLVELLDPGVEPALVARLGPDLLDPEADLREAARRLRSQAELPIGEALMRQDLAAGIGNVLKSEALFLARVSPFARVGELDEEALVRVLDTARRVMARSVRTGTRVTRARAGSRLWVYGRSGQPCFACGTLVRMRRQGESARSTYFCPACQGVS